ncbi:MAG: ribosome maturation factor RimM [Propionibacteriaceae bacterium]|jgi:16S rRNA processing protein RimM|nr:ribosome maturation factor RimM [Propionibacteriaceae bacterium]
MPQIDVTVGTLGRARGLTGELFVDLTTDSPADRFRAGAVVYVGTRPLTVTAFHRQGDRGLVRFDGIADRTAAEQLTGAELTALVDDDETPADEGEFYDHQLVGLAVVTTTGAVAGRVSRVEHLGFQDLLVVKTAADERLVPFVGDLVPEVDLAQGRIVIAAIPGLLED